MLAVTFVVTSACQAEDVTPILTARKRPEPVQKQLLVDDNEQTNLDNSELVIPEEVIAPVFKPYQPAKGEVVFSYTKSWINAIDPTASTNRAGSYLPGARGANQLVIYTPNYGIRTNTNEFGA